MRTFIRGAYISIKEKIFRWIVFRWKKISLFVNFPPLECYPWNSPWDWVHVTRHPSHRLWAQCKPSWLAILFHVVSQCEVDEWVPASFSACAKCVRNKLVPVKIPRYIPSMHSGTVQRTQSKSFVHNNVFLDVYFFKADQSTVARGIIVDGIDLDQSCIWWWKRSTRWLAICWFSHRPSLGRRHFRCNHTSTTNLEKA
jgi:hypothetical protein